MKTNSKLLLIPLLIIFTAMGVPQELTEMNYHAYLKSDKEAWKQNVAYANKLHQEKPSEETLFQLALTEYGLLNVTMVDNDKKLFSDYADDCQEKLESLVESKKFGAEAKALLSGVYGFKIAYSPLKGMFYGPKSSTLLEQAMEENPSSPIVLKIYASNQYFTPEMWGGNKDLALKAFKKSTENFGKHNLEKSWMNLDNLAWIGLIYQEEGQLDKAKSTWEKAVEIEPNFYWVSKSLLPTIN